MFLTKNMANMTSASDISRFRYSRRTRVGIRSLFSPRAYLGLSLRCAWIFWFLVFGARPVGQGGPGGASRRHHADQQHLGKVGFLIGTFYKN